MFKTFNQIGKDAIALLIGSLSTRVLSLVLLPLYTHYFSTADYGLLEVVNITASVIGIVSALGMVSAFGREFLQKTNSVDDQTQVLSTSVLFIAVFSLVVAVVTFFLSGTLTHLIGVEQGIAPKLLKVAVVRTYFATLAALGGKYLIISSKIAIYSFISFIEAVLVMLASIWAVSIMRQSLYELYIYQTAVKAIFALGYIIFLCYQGKINWSGPRLRSMLAFALPMVPAALSYYVMTSSDRFFLQRFASTADVGIYSVAYRIGLLLQIVLVTPLTSLIPVQVYRISKQENCGLVIRRLLEVMTLILMTGTVGLGLLAPYLVRLLAPDSYWSASSLVIWVAIAYALYGLNFVLVSGINLSGKSYYQTIAITVAALLNLVMNGILIPRVGMMGAAIATTIAYLAQTILTACFAQYLYPVPYRFIRTGAFTLMFLTGYLLANCLPLEPLWLMLMLKSIVLTLVLSSVALLFFKTELLALWGKVQLLFPQRNVNKQ